MSLKREVHHLQVQFDRSSSKIKTDETLIKHQDPPTPSQELQWKGMCYLIHRNQQYSSYGKPPRINNAGCKGKKSERKVITRELQVKEISATDQPIAMRPDSNTQIEKKKYGIYETSGNLNTGLVFNDIKELKLILQV